MTDAQLNAAHWLTEHGFDFVLEGLDEGATYGEQIRDLWGFHWGHSDQDHATRSLFERAERRIARLYGR